ncbi:MAG: hypothetical protein KAT90_10970 [Gammaproteobacteria bacterium]|nr:hypothetical protein [Gammaproteobacteria bacterium]
MNNILRKITFLLILSLAACVSNQSNMTAANDEDEDIGLGGTGMLANTDSGDGNGLGGTGILGKITGYGSIFVNGIEIEYDSETAFTINGKKATPQPLEIGDVVEVLTIDNKQHTQAQKINLRHEIIGVVESVEPQTYSFTIQGQSIIQSIDKSIFPEVGTTVAVSGFRINEQTILSTRVTPAKTGQTLLRTGTELPFNKQAERWLIQMHIQNGKAIFEHNGIAQVFSMNESINKPVESRLDIKILQLHKSTTEKLELNQVIKPVDILRGRRTLNPVKHGGGNMMKKSIQSPMPAPYSGAGSMQTQTQTQPKIKQNKR